MQNTTPKQVAVIGGVGQGSELSCALIDKLLANDYLVVAIARSLENKQRLTDRYANNTDVFFVSADLADHDATQALFTKIEARHGSINVYIHNAAKLVLKPFMDIKPLEFYESWQQSAATAFNVSQALLPRMQQRGQGNIILLGATASWRANAKGAAFAGAKFALRALGQALAREFGPQGIHIAHIVIDGVISGERAQQQFSMPLENCIQPEAVANTCLMLIAQDPSCWTQELDIRPQHETF